MPPLPDLILTGRDPEAMQKYPRVVDGVDLIEGELPQGTAGRVALASFNSTVLSYTLS